ncbi:MAG: DOMON-like domain-containing protein [Hydrococcus sp. Prado102]|jgi:hypothetical protein|nr:DOMON-like domain-containing protein [Hydrococcus sp. Prado102]
MNDHFSLQPFDSIHPLDLKIDGSISRNENTLFVSYTLFGDLSKIVIPATVNLPIRKHELWEETCFEFFLGIKNLTRYWEFNLSPAGHWNIYRFDDYRQGMQEEMAMMSLPFSVQNQSEALLLILELDLDKFISVDTLLDVAITTVIKSQEGNISYWALTHTGSQADFHRRDSFIIDL